MSSRSEVYIDNMEYFENDDDKLLYDISISVSLLENRELYYEGMVNGSMLKDRVRSLKNGLEFLCELYLLSMEKAVKPLAADVKNALTTYEEDNGLLDIMKLEHEYEHLREVMRNLVRHPRPRYFSFIMHNYRRITDLFLENICEILSTCCNSASSTSNDETAAFVKKVKYFRSALTYYIPLYRFLACAPHLGPNPAIRGSLDSVLQGAVVAVYLLLVGKMDEKTVVSSLEWVMNSDKRCRKLNIYWRFLKFMLPFGKSSQFFILDNLINVLAMNSDSLNDANNHLYLELRELQTFVENQRGSEMLNHYLGLTASTESICYQSLPIVYSCYMEEAELEEEMRQKLNDILISVIGQIKMIKLHHSSQEIKLYDYPKVDCFGFLEYFMGYLKELQGHEQISGIRTEIESIHLDIHYLMSSSNTSQEKLTSDGLWTNIVRLSYQAEYVIELYLIIPDSRCISTLCNIVEQLKETREKQLALPDKSLHVEDVVTTSNNAHGMPLHVNNEFLGFSEEIGDIMKYISRGENDLQTISIVGMGGAGKTSLAKHLFKDPTVDGHFDKKAWCTASQSYQRKDLLRTLLNQISPFESDIKMIDDQDLADKLCRCLKKRRYLVFIDDVWDVDLWNDLSVYFPNDKTQSRIIITTRDHNVALKTKSKIVEIRALTEGESWELLQTKLPQQESLPKNLVSIAKEVAKSCKGLPLSIVIIGGLLHNAGRNEEMWNQIAKDVTSSILSEPQGKCEDILELSYSHLPNHLKSCLLYLGVFPEDNEISVTRLVRLWVAEGLVQRQRTSEECVEDVGKRYLHDLITRSLVIPIKEKTEGGVKIIQLHDLLRDFCLKKAKETSFFTVLDDKSIFDLSHCPRRICINHGMDKHLPFVSLNGIRTIFSFCKPDFLNSDIERMMESDHMMLLNVLDMQKLMAPASYVHHFVHLRYLAIWNIDRKDQILLQSSFFKLWNLQVLVLVLSYSDRHVFEVPDFIWDLVKLRHIHLLPSALFPRHDKKRLEDSSILLENLKSLSKPRLHYGDSIWLNKLPELQKLSCIFFTSWSDHLQQCRFPELDLCNRLTSLKVENGVEENQRERSKLCFPASLRKLSLSKFVLESDDISEIGKSLPHLEVLKLHDSIENWIVSEEDFPKLKFLRINGWGLQEWDVSEDSFPSLEQLWLQSCRSLKTIPLSFGDIPCLRLISIKKCMPSVYESAREIVKIQAEGLNMELKLDLS